MGFTIYSTKYTTLRYINTYKLKNYKHIIHINNILVDMIGRYLKDTIEIFVHTFVLL